MTMSDFPPGLVLILGAFLLPVVARNIRSMLILGLPLLTLGLIWSVPDGSFAILPFLDYQLVFVRSDLLSRLFATVFSIMTFAGGLYALKQKRLLELVAVYVYAGSAVGVVFAGDMISLFIFWEIMALASTVVLLSADGSFSYRVSMRYFLVHALGGVLLMVGILAHIHESGSTAFTAMQPDSFGTILILAGFLINAAAPPLSAWLSDAYPEASYTGTVFLSAFTTKAAVYALLRGFPGAEILIFIGIFMIFYGIIYALLENDMRRILAYSIVNQVGFMVTGIGIGTEMAQNGVAAHAFTHIIYKALLLMSAGSVLYMTGKRKCTDLGGLFQSMPITTACGIIGALSISSFPLTSGFISKSMISQSAADESLIIVWFMLLAASAGVFLHAGIKFPWFVFFQKDSGLRPPDPPWNMKLAMILFAGLCIGLGIWPEYLYNLLPHPVAYEPYTVPHVVNMLQLLMFSGFAFFLLLPLMRRTLTISLDFDWLYRRVLPKALHRVFSLIWTTDRNLRQGFTVRLDRGLAFLSRRHEGVSGLLSRTYPVGSMVMWVSVILAAYLFLSFITH
ncbi:MAG: Na(+)/H(+) antiporter subunit D [Gammaproteobacteria bacterium]|nr:Na(+)/H(+) antiporter subunit D [Gammaproteobacteria bacterium]